MEGAKSSTSVVIN